MKEYLSLPEKQDENRDTSENNESEANSAEENINSVDGVVGAENSSVVVNHENGHAVSGCSKDEAKLEKDSTSQSSSNPMRQFKNVVAIVDPPRVGLHPTVSDLQAFLCICSSGKWYPSLNFRLSIGTNLSIPLQAYNEMLHALLLHSCYKALSNVLDNYSCECR